MKSSTLKKKLMSKKTFHFSKEDFSRENIIEGGVIRPLILMGAFFSFLGAMFLLLLGARGEVTYLKWGGSLLIFSFILNLQSIYSSLTDEPSIFRTMNLIFKITLFLAEIIVFNWFGVTTGMYTVFSF
jgi:hypothetical protein